MAIMEKPARLPDPERQRILRRYRPRIWLAEGQPEPIDFYRDYIAHGRLYDGNGTLVDVDNLHDLRFDPLALFIHDPPEAATSHPTIYGRIDDGTVELGGMRTDLIFLTYNMAFRHSGLIAGLPTFINAILYVIGNPKDWHQLDHYVSLTLTFIAAADGSVGAPMAATFQQHNYARTYRLGGEDGPGRLDWPEDGRLPVDVAIRSNELYPHWVGRTMRRAAGFMSRESADFLISGENQPLRAGFDITDAARQLDDIALVTLPSDDAFYVFRGRLGEKRVLPGRSGPPGANYATLPSLIPWQRRVFAFYWHEEMTDYGALIESIRQRGGLPDISVFTERFVADWQQAAPPWQKLPASEGR